MAANPIATVPIIAETMPLKLWLADLRAALVPPTEELDIEPAAWTAPPRKVFPQVLLI